MKKKKKGIFGELEPEIGGFMIGGPVGSYLAKKADKWYKKKKR